MKKKQIFWAAEKILKNHSLKNISRFNYNLFIKNQFNKGKRKKTQHCN